MHRSMFMILSMVGLFSSNLNATAAAEPLDSCAIDRFIVAQMAAQRVPGLSLAVTRGDRVLYTKGYGTAGDGQPVTPRTQFFIASLSKSITALAVLQLVEAGTIDLDAPVQTYLPTFTLADPAQAGQITIRHLLNQIGGLADAGFPEALLPQPDSLAGRIASLHGARVVAPPGTTFHYFNPNYQVLARVVEVVSGEPFARYVRTRIFEPLQMHDSFSAVTGAEALQRAERLADGHLVVFGVPVAKRELDGFLAGSGGVVSTAEDMARYLIAHNNGGRYGGTTVAAPASMAALHTPPREPDSAYAMGWFVHDSGGMRVIEHNGILSTYYAEAVLLPESGYGFVLLANVSGATSAFVGFPQIKRGLIALLSDGRAPTSPIGVGAIGALMGLLTLLGVGMALRSLLRLPRWEQQTRARPWRSVLSAVWSFAPLLVLLGLPGLLVRMADRAFGYTQIVRSMPDVVILLGLTGAFGALNGVARLALLMRGTVSGRSSQRQR